MNQDELQRTRAPAPGGILSESRPTVSVVVVSYNTRDLLRRCLRKLIDQGQEVLVVDNASTDGSAELVRTEFPGVRLIAMAKNVGYGAGANAGLRATDGPCVLLLNADAWPEDGAVERLLEHAEREPGVAMVGPRLVDERGRPQRSVFAQPLGGFALATSTAFPHLVSGAYGLWQRAIRRDRVVEAREFVMGAALLMRRDAVVQVGGFDEAFFMYDEEVDLAFRLRRAGWRIEFCPSAVFVHIGGASTRTAPEQMRRERLRSHIRFLAKHRGLRTARSGRRLLVFALRIRRWRSEAAWLAGTPLETLLK
jgi:GT2 family glycosyltransferase